MLKLEQIAPCIWAILGDEPEEAAYAFVRFQEYYENPELKGKKDISISDVEKWWKKKARVRGLSDIYCEAWAGFNIPGRIILELLRSPSFRPRASIKDLVMSRWNREEDEFLKLIEHLSIEDIQTGYFIAMWKDSKDVLEHEIAHAFFTTQTPYKAEQMLNISYLPSNIYKSFSARLKDMGYHSEVINDEIQAYLSTYKDGLEKIFLTDKYKDFCGSFIETFQRYRNFLKP